MHTQHASVMIFSPSVPPDPLSAHLTLPCAPGGWPVGTSHELPCALSPGSRGAVGNRRSIQEPPEQERWKLDVSFSSLTKESGGMAVSLEWSTPQNCPLQGHWPLTSELCTTLSNPLNPAQNSVKSISLDSPQVTQAESAICFSLGPQVIHTYFCTHIIMCTHECTHTHTHTHIERKRPPPCKLPQIQHHRKQRKEKMLISPICNFSKWIFSLELHRKFTFKEMQCFLILE